MRTVAVVTGAGRGIGRAVAGALARQGHRVVLAARTESEVLAAAERIRAAGGRAEAVAADVGREEDVRGIFDRARQAFGPVTLLVNNAGTLNPRPFEELSPDEFDRTLSSNLRGAFLCARAAFADMAAAGGGCIVNIASLSGVYGVEKFPGMAAYIVAKFGIVGLTEALAVEGRAQNIRAVALAPGAVDTALLRKALPGVGAGVKPAEIAEMVLFLASPAAAGFNGMTIPLFSNR